MEIDRLMKEITVWDTRCHEWEEKYNALLIELDEWKHKCSSSDTIIIEWKDKCDDWEKKWKYLDGRCHEWEEKCHEWEEKCHKCEDEFYCSTACRKQHYSVHKRVCRPAWKRPWQGRAAGWTTHATTL